MMAAEATLAAHVGIILFNLFGLVAIPVGALRHWHFVRIGWWRVLHIVFLAAVAVQAVAGRACILTSWQAELSGVAAAPTPLIMSFVDRLVYWRLPIWVCGVAYVAVFTYALALLWLVPPQRAAPRSTVAEGNGRCEHPAQPPRG